MKLSIASEVYGKIYIFILLILINYVSTGRLTFSNMPQAVVCSVIVKTTTTTINNSSGNSLTTTEVVNSTNSGITSTLESK